MCALCHVELEVEVHLAREVARVTPRSEYGAEAVAKRMEEGHSCGRADAVGDYAPRITRSTASATRR